MVNTEKIMERMKEKGVNQKNLAEKCGVSRPTINQKIHGVRPISLKEAQIIQNVLEIPEKEFGLYFFAQ